MRKFRLLLAATALVTAAPVAMWGLWGQQNAAGYAPSELDYAYRPWDLPDGLDGTLGWVALIIVLAAGAVLVADTVRGLLAAE